MIDLLCIYPGLKGYRRLRDQWVKLISFLSILGILSCTRPGQDRPYQDLTHSSQVFNHAKAYRIYLPAKYSDKSSRFPVIYFFHGWGGRHFKDDNAKLEYEKIKQLVDKYKVILVMWDGNITEDQPRPYNIGNHENINSQVQMCRYFIELKDHIDSTYRTLSDRAHRGIIGFSMGGFLSYFIAGKYPDLVSASVNMTGSPEFFVGHPDNHTLYPLRYTFKNLNEVHLRFHNSTADELTDLNKEVHQGALWEGGLSYDYWVFEGGHKVDDPGKTEVFEKAMQFVINAFEHPRPRPVTWSHYDIYPGFSVWGYEVKTTKHEPGFIDLNRVDTRGFGIQSLRWLPQGPAIPGIEFTITTAPMYRPSTAYQIVQYFQQQKKIDESILISDQQGRLHFPPVQNGYVAGIYLGDDQPAIIPVGYLLEKGHRMLRPGVENKLSIDLLNRGSDFNQKSKVKLKIYSRDTGVRILNDTHLFGVDPGKRLYKSPEFIISVHKNPPGNAAPSEVKFSIHIDLDSVHTEDEIIVPVFYQAPVFNHFMVDDGRPVKDSLPAYGQGNGDGIIQPGEEITVYVDGHRTRIYTDDPYVQTANERLIDEALPAKWPDGFTLTSVIRIDPSCPNAHRIECLFNYETKDFMPINRKLTWGKLWLEVKSH